MHTMTEPSLQPIAARERIEALDVIRGFALLGIFLMNIEWFSRPLQELGHGIPAGLTGADHTAAWFVYFFVQGKFWTLFSLLFGMGFAVMAERAQATGGPFTAIYLRRSFVLLALGVLHALLLWPGDILHSYAIAALILLGLHSVGRRALLGLGIGLYVALAASALLFGLMMSVMPAEEMAPMVKEAEKARVAAAAAAQAYAQGGWLEVTAQRARDFLQVLSFDVAVVPSALGMFLIGAWFVRSGKIGDVAAHRGFFLKLALAGLTLGLALTAWSTSFGISFEAGREMGRQMVASALHMLGALPLSLGYLALIALGLTVPAIERWLAWLAPAGRMALTNYLLQSLIASLIFYGYGLAQWGQIGRAGQVGLVLAIFAGQLLLSRWWLSRYRFGPMEWLWRWATYGRRPAMAAAPG